MIYNRRRAWDGRNQVKAFPRPPATDGVSMRSMIVEQLKSYDAKPHDVRGDIRDATNSFT